MARKTNRYKKRQSQRKNITKHKPYVVGYKRRKLPFQQVRDIRTFKYRRFDTNKNLLYALALLPKDLKLRETKADRQRKFKDRKLRNEAWKREVCRKRRLRRISLFAMANMKKRTGLGKSIIKVKKRSKEYKEESKVRC